jgi:hypothetical protein
MVSGRQASFRCAPHNQSKKYADDCRSSARKRKMKSTAVHIIVVTTITILKTTMLVAIVTTAILYGPPPASRSLSGPLASLSSSGPLPSLLSPPGFPAALPPHFGVDSRRLQIRLKMDSLSVPRNHKALNTNTPNHQSRNHSSGMNFGTGSPNGNSRDRGAHLQTISHQSHNYGRLKVKILKLRETTGS